MSLGKSGEEVMAAPPRLISLLEFGSTPPPDMPEQVFSVIRRVSNQLDSIMTSESDTVVRRTRTSSLFAVDPSRMPAIAARQRFSSVALLPGSPAASKDRIHDENIATPSSPAAPEPAVEHTLNTLQAGPEIEALGDRFKGLNQVQLSRLWHLLASGDTSVSAAAAQVLLESRAQPFGCTVDDYVNRYLQSHVMLSSKEEVVVTHVLIATGMKELIALEQAPRVATGEFRIQYFRAWFRMWLWIRPRTIGRGMHVAHTSSTTRVSAQLGPQQSSGTGCGNCFQSLNTRHYLAWLVTLFQLAHMFVCLGLAFADRDWYGLNPTRNWSPWAVIIRVARMANAGHLVHLLLLWSQTVSSPLVVEALEGKGYQATWLNRLRSNLKHMLLINHAVACALCAAVLTHLTATSASSLSWDRPGLCITYAVAVLGYFYNVSYFATYDAKRQPSKLLDWVKLALFDLTLNWLVILVDTLISILMLVCLPLTALMVAASYCCPLAHLPTAWLERVCRYSGFSP